jgi:hypothetical protein
LSFFSWFTPPLWGKAARARYQQPSRRYPNPYVARVTDILSGHYGLSVYYKELSPKALISSKIRGLA